MNSKYNASMSFEFTNSGQRYSYNGDKCEVSGQNLSDSIKYMPDRVNQCLQTGDWIVIEPSQEFPRSGAYAKYENTKVFIVGKSSYGVGMWVCERTDGSLVRMHRNKMFEIDITDNKAFTMSLELGITYAQALNMVKKGYGKL